MSYETGRGQDSEDNATSPSSDTGGAAEPYFVPLEPSPMPKDSDGISMGPRESHQSYEIANGVIFQPVFGHNILLNFVTFPAHGGFPSHRHPEEQFGVIIEGEVEMTIGDKTTLMRKGDIYTAPPDVPHEGRTFERACLILDIFSPPRAGFRELIARANPVRPATQWWAPEEPA